LGEYLVDLLGYFPIVMPFLTCDSLTLPIQLDLIELSNWLLMSSILICTHAAVRSNFSHRFHGAGIYSNYIYICANIKGVYWWDPCYQTNSSTMDPMGFEITKSFSKHAMAHIGTNIFFWMSPFLPWLPKDKNGIHLGLPSRIHRTSPIQQWIFPHPQWINDHRLL
jgi:hypothetical protein